ncbi:MAG: cysteine desulfurase [Lachnospiraceae bacterium]|nr:cysteine desulfurase [Lachnospiraceae bacterium]
MENRDIYLDNSATTMAFPEVCELVGRTMSTLYGNPSSLHSKGMAAAAEIKTARERIAKTLKCEEKEIVFTSCGTEADNLAIIGGALANSRAGKHLITSSIEHPAVLNSMKTLEDLGFEVTYLPVDETARIRLSDLEAAIRPDTILVSLMYINNEVGSVMPIAEAGALIKRVNPRTLFHVDAVQAYGKRVIKPSAEKIDMLSASGHKIHAGKGVGFLYIRTGVKVKPLMVGGGQQKGMRSGTENVPGIAAMGLASQMLYKNIAEDLDRLYELKEYFISQVSTIEGAYVNGLTGRDSAPHVISVSFSGIKSQVFLNALNQKGIYVSSGSACSTNHPGISDTLKAMGVKKELLDSTIRFSMSVFTAKEDLDYTLESIREVLPMLRKFTKR